MVLLKVSVWVLMTSMPALARSAGEDSAGFGLTQLMSYDCSGLPGIWTAVRHLVCVVVGAPGPVHWACAAPDVASDTAPNSIEATTSMPSRFGRRPISASSESREEPEEYVVNILYLL